MSFLRKAARAVGSAIGKTLLYTAAAVTAFAGAVGATPHRNDSVDVIDMAAAPDQTGTYGHVYFPGDTGSVSGSIEFKPWESIPCWYGCSGELTVPSEYFDEPNQTYDPGEDIDPADLPVAALDGDMWFDLSIFETVSHSDPVSTGVSYVQAVPERHVIAEHSTFRRLIEVVDVSDLRVAIPPREYESSEFRQLPFNRYTYFVWLENGAIPSNAIPSNYTTLSRNIGGHTPGGLFDDAFQAAIPSNVWGMIYAIPSNLTRQDLIDMGANADQLPAAIPSNLTVEHLRSYGIPVVSPAIPSNAIPSNAIPSNAIPSNAIPSNAIPSNAIPSNAIPSNAIPSNAIPSNLMPPMLSVLEQLNPDDLVRGPGLLDQMMAQSFQPEFQVYLLDADDSITSRGRIVVDKRARESGEFQDLIADLWQDEYGVETAWSSSDDNRVYMACNDSCETVALPYRTGVEQAPVVGVETVTVGPIGVETVMLGPTVGVETLLVCAEDLSGSPLWLGHLSSGDFTFRYLLDSGESYQSSSYQLSIDNQLLADCVLDPENPRLLHCTRDGIVSERWVPLTLLSQPGSCELWSDSYYVCPYGETYYGQNMWWGGGCCTTSCWCTLSGDTQPGCWNSCPGCPP